MIQGTIGGMIGGVVGAVIWWAVSYLAHREGTWVALGVGVMVGLGVRYGATLGGEDESKGHGILAAALAIGSVLLGKFLVYTAIVGWSDSSRFREFADMHEDAMIAELANEIVSRMNAAGQEIAWPPSVNPEAVSRPADYPPAIWQQAMLQWKQLDPVGQEERVKARLMLVEQLFPMKKPGVVDFFSFYDVLWIGFATIAAYTIGKGTYGTD